MKFILGKKLGMSQVFHDDGSVTPVTVIAAGPCLVTQVKTKERDGYGAVQLGFGEKKHVSKALAGHLAKIQKSPNHPPIEIGGGTGQAKVKSQNLRWLREFRVTGEEVSGMKVGDEVTVSVFQGGDKVKVSALSKGKGFQGVVKRHGFHGAPASHGTKHALRQPGSIGATFPERVIKGMRMAGRMGGERVSVKNIKVVKVDSEHNVMAVEGAVPGARGTLVEIRGI